MAAWPSSWLLLLLVAALLAFEDWLATPTCSGGSTVPASGDLRVMMVSDLMLLGSDASYADRFFRNHFMSKLFAKSIQTLKPDIIVVLGDISAEGFKLTESKWIDVLDQFEGILGQYSVLPLHVSLGDKDVGGCASLDNKFVHRVTKHLPELDSGGCSAFEISNVSFVSLNAVALLCGNNPLRFSVEKVIERENHHFQQKMVNEDGHFSLGSVQREGFNWRQNNMESGSGPVVLLHFPLYKSHEPDKFDGEDIGVPNFSEGTASESPVYSSLRERGANSYDQLHAVPANSTQYILQALKPRIVFSAHDGTFSDYTHDDGTREVAVPAMTQKITGVPGFVIATFGSKGLVTVRHCLIVPEWYG
uniref:Calcineurin-like phosphoesterase domain-containing protein n=1 Tax=Leersia perrieri TaxID=77586 RepID=A0A0D9WNF2_9ORYZ